MTSPRMSELEHLIDGTINRTWSLAADLEALQASYADFMENPPTSKQELRRRRSTLAQEALRTADGLALASAEVRTTYWGLRDREEV